MVFKWQKKLKQYWLLLAKTQMKKALPTTSEVAVTAPSDKIMTDNWQSACSRIFKATTGEVVIQ